FTSLLLVMFSLQMSRKTVPYTGQMGELQSDQLESISSGHKALVYLDQSAEFALQDTIVEFFSKSGGVCGGVWETIDGAERGKPIKQRAVQKCIPQEGALQESFEGLFNSRLDAYLSSFPEKNIPLSNFDLVYTKKSKDLEVIGFGTRDIVFPSERALSLISEEEIGKKRQNAARNSKDSAEQKCTKKSNTCAEYTDATRCDFDPCNAGCYWEDRCRKIESVVYAVKPGFRITSDYDFLEGMGKVKAVIEMYRRELERCLLQDFEVYRDDARSDIRFCGEAVLEAEDNDENSETTELKALVDTFDRFDVVLEDRGVSYSVFFTIADADFSHRWDATKATTKVEMHFWDTFAPPSSRGFAQDRESPVKMVWDKNPASDVEKVLLGVAEKVDGECNGDEGYHDFAEFLAKDKCPAERCSVDLFTFSRDQGWNDDDVRFLKRPGKIGDKEYSGGYCVSLAMKDVAGNIGEGAVAEYQVSGTFVDPPSKN
ncbi:MAG: hypothetical protein O2779_03265, partial [Nanoarchaeota archaeon]|nr:hypothetical protein [Nanoarchaeota archaeon]